MVFIGFSLELMRQVKELMPEFQVLLLGFLIPPLPLPSCFSSSSFSMTSPSTSSSSSSSSASLSALVSRTTRRLVERAKEAGLDGIDVPADSTTVTQAAVDYAKHKGLCVATWVYPGQKETPRLYSAKAAAGVDFHTSNLPLSVLAWRDMAAAAAEEE